MILEFDHGEAPDWLSPPDGFRGQLGVFERHLQQGNLASREIDRRLQIYPQFGQPMQDLSIDEARSWIGVVPPLVVRYVIDEAHRQVLFLIPPAPFSHTGL
jgi:hypothetical protein